MNGILSGSFQGGGGKSGGGTVTAVTGVAPIVSSGGATPAISITDASNLAFGAVKVDGTTITASAGVISASAGSSAAVTSVTGNAPISSSGGLTPAISVSPATSAALGVVQPDGTIITVAAGAITVPKASNAQFGVVEVDNTTITASGGVISAVAGGAPAIAQLAQQTLAAPAATITFSAIPGTYSSLKLTIIGRSSDAANSDNLVVEFNIDSGANYSSQYNLNQDTTGSVLQTLAGSPTTAAPGILPAANGPANVSGIVDMEIIGYANTTFFKAANLRSVMRGNLTAECLLELTGFMWNNTAAIATITLSLGSASNFVTGSQFTLYGLK
jgi:hypothetical protein